MKVIAYLDQFGHETVTPYSAKRKNIKTVYSTHKPGERIEMYVNRRGVNHYFAYKGENGDSSSSNPETLTHTLCKEVIAELASNETHTELKFFNKFGVYAHHPPVPIKLTHGFLEHQIVINGNRYSIDAYCEFYPANHIPDGPESPADLLSLYRQWSGQIAFEIYHTHKVGEIKMRDLESAGIPVFQIGIHSNSALYIDEDEIAKMDDAQADSYLQKHREKLRRIFSKSIGGVVLNDPKSPGFLAAQDLYCQLSERESEIIRLRDEILLKNETLDDFEEQSSVVERQMEQLRQEYSNLMTKLQSSSIENTELKAINLKLKEENQRLIIRKPKSWIERIIGR